MRARRHRPRRVTPKRRPLCRSCLDWSERAPTWPVRSAPLLDRLFALRYARRRAGVSGGDPLAAGGIVRRASRIASLTIASRSVPAPVPRESSPGKKCASRPRTDNNR